ncbi:Arm DNA-binding domain-containing protein [Pseudomonas sp. MWU12-2037]|uniref:Arm DNA-binding domain-containing protein n=1 Tax=Pseudomonas sp. MWU12-2037 TaxID=2928690 RepID=UPI00200BAB4D|nr:Arm DNA-binding domain-containing protein [Pseudomonas sp. MWU12-2037]
MALTDSAVRHAKPCAKDYTLADYDGLALFVNTKGAKCWHFRFSWENKQPRISTYPEISLRDARVLCDVARALVARGIDSRVHRQLGRDARRLATENA